MSNRMEITRSVRVPDKMVDLMLTQMESQPEARRAESLRRHKRFVFRVSNMLVRMQQPGATSASQFYSHTRNISAGGVSFLHGGFVHIGTKVLARPPRTDGLSVDLMGRVVSCRYLERGIHEVNVAFEELVDPGNYSAAAISYEFLIVEDDDAIARLAEHHLGLLNVEVSRARNGAEAVDRLKRRRFDCVLMDMQMPVKDGWDAVAEARAAGYGGRIVAMTALNGPMDEQRCLEVGCDDYLAKPVMPTTYRKLVDALVAHPVVSRFAEDPSMTEMICEWCEGIPGALREIREHQDAGDRIAFGNYLRDFRGRAGSFGFDEVERGAEALERVIDCGAEDAELEKAVGEFLDICKRVESPMRNQLRRDDEKQAIQARSAA